MWPRNFFAARYFTPNYWALGFGSAIIITFIFRRIAGVRRLRAH